MNYCYVILCQFGDVKTAECVFLDYEAAVLALAELAAAEVGVSRAERCRYFLEKVKLVK